jgi:hypothetical protein
MATDISSELSQFQEFIVHVSKSGSTPASLDEAVVEFREYQRQLADLKEKVRIGLEQCQRGEAIPFDIEETKRRVRERLAKDGIK